MPKVTQTLGNNKARAWESLGFAHKKGCASILTQPLFVLGVSEYSHLNIIINFIIVRIF